MDTERNTGRTTKQIKDAPNGAVFVAPSTRLVDYCFSIAKSVGREDVKVVSPQWLENGSWRGLRFPDVIMDHHAPCVMTERQLDAYRYAKMRCESQPS